MPFDKLQSIHTQHKEKLPSGLKDRTLQTDKDQATFLNDLLKHKMGIDKSSSQNKEVEENSAEELRKQKENIRSFIQKIDEICPFSQIHNHFSFTEEHIKILSTKWELGIWTAESRAVAIRCKLIKALLTNFTCGPIEQKAEEESDGSTSAWAPKDAEQFVKLVETIFSGGFNQTEPISKILDDINKATPALDRDFKRNISQILAQKIKIPEISSSESNIKNESFLHQWWRKTGEQIVKLSQDSEKKEAQKTAKSFWDGGSWRKKPLDNDILPEVDKSNPQTDTPTTSLEVKAEETKEEKQEKITPDLLSALSTSISKLRKEKRLTRTTLEILFSAAEPEKIEWLGSVCLHKNLSMELLDKIYAEIQKLNQSSVVTSEEKKSTMPRNPGLLHEGYFRWIDALLKKGCDSEDIEKVLAADERRSLIKKNSDFLQNFAGRVLDLKKAERLEEPALKILSLAKNSDDMCVLGAFCQSPLVAVEVLEAISVSVTDSELAIQQFHWVNKLLECDCGSDSIVSALKAANKREGFFSKGLNFLEVAAPRVFQLQEAKKLIPITLSILFLGNDSTEFNKLTTIGEFLDQQVLEALHNAIQKNPQTDPNKMSDYYSLIHGLLSKGLNSRHIAEIFITNNKKVSAENITIITQEKCREILAETNSASCTADDFISKYIPFRHQEFISRIFPHLPLPPGAPLDVKENKRSDSRGDSISYLGDAKGRIDRPITPPLSLFPSSPSAVLSEENEPSVVTKVYLGYFMGGALVLGLGALISYTSIEHFDKTQAVKEVFSEHWIEMLVMTGVAIVVAGLGYRAFREHCGAKEIAEEEPEELLLYDPLNK